MVLVSAADLWVETETVKMASYLLSVACSISFCCNCCAVSCGYKCREVVTVMPATWRCQNLQKYLEVHYMSKFIVLP